MQAALATWTGPLGASETMSSRSRVREDGRSASGERPAVPLVAQALAEIERERAAEATVDRLPDREACPSSKPRPPHEP